MKRFLAGLVTGLVAGIIIGAVGAVYTLPAMAASQKPPVDLQLPAEPLHSAGELARFLEKRPYEVGYFARNLATGKTIDRFADRPVCLASIVKIFCLTELYRQVQDGDLDLEQEIAVPGHGSLSLKRAADLMIGQSDNAATEALADFLGRKNVNRIPMLLGITSLSADILPDEETFRKTLDKRIFGKRVAAKALPQHGTARGVAAYFERLLNRQVISEDVSNRILEFFAEHPKPFSIHYAGEYSFAGKGGNLLWTRPPKHYSMMGWGLFVKRPSGEHIVLCVWGEWFPENMPPDQQSEFLKYVTDCVLSIVGS